MTTPPPWGGPPQGAPQWGQPAQAPPQWGGPQQEQASWGAPPPPQWGAAPAAPDAPAYGYPPPATTSPDTASDSVLPTVFGHLVLWLGLVLYAFAYRPIVRIFYDLTSVPTDLLNATIGLLSVLPVALAVVIVGRGAVLRWVALLGAVALVVAAIVLNLVAFAGAAYLLPSAMAVLALGTWIAVRRHARVGYLVLVPAAVLAALWFGPVGLDLRSFPYEHGVQTTGLLILWSDLPIVVLALLGLVSSVLRPRPSPDRDATAFFVVGGLVVLAALAGAVAAFL